MILNHLDLLLIQDFRLVIVAPKLEALLPRKAALICLLMIFGYNINMN